MISKSLMMISNFPATDYKTTRTGTGKLCQITASAAINYSTELQRRGLLEGEKIGRCVMLKLTPKGQNLWILLQKLKPYLKDNEVNK